MNKSQKKQLFKTRALALRQAFLPISYKLTALNFNVLDSHNKLLNYVNKKTSTFEDISRQVQSRLDALYVRSQTTNQILLLYGVAFTAICIILLFI